MNYDSIKSRINQFKTNNDLDENIYNKILNDLDELYKIKSNAFIQITSNQYILNEKENFKIYLIGKLLNKSIEENKLKNYEIAYKYIKQIEELKPSGNYLETKDKLESYIKFNLNIKEGKKLIENKEFKEAIQYFKKLKETAINLDQYKILNQGYELAKTKYFTYLNEEIINLLPKKSEKNCIKKCKDIINKCEFIFKEYQNEKQLKTKLSDIKRQIYIICLEKIIEEKAEKNEDYTNELNKYRITIEIENMGENVLSNFIYKVLNKLDSKKKNNLNKNEIRKQKKAILQSTKFDDISLEIVDYYINIIKEINEVDLNEVGEEIKTQIINYNSESNMEHDDPIKWFKSNENNIKNNNFRGRVFAVFNQVNKKITEFDIRPIQLISLLFLTKGESKLGGIFLQINTGEGKTLIIQFLAAYLALLGNKVDIISSSVVLADTDADNKDIQDFYKDLGLTSGKASNDEYDKDIVYGDTLNFEAGILKEEFKEQKVRYNRPFDCVIIDEVDSISLDNIISMAQLTDSFPGRSCYQYFYYQILICFCQIISESPKITEEKGYKEIIHGQIKKMLIGKILEEDGKHLKSDLPIIYPKSMKENIEESIDPWIDSTIRAFTMTENRDFIVRKNIVLVDHLMTGVIQKNMTLDRGTHQILQILFNTKSTFENENTNFLSNISFFKRYKGNIYGVTGTFGGPNFQYILRTVYEVKLYKIPPYKTSLLEDKGSYVFIDEQSYKNKILENIKNMIEKKRSVLLICDSIGKGQEFLDLLNNDYKGNVMKYFTEEDESTVNNILSVGKIIVATNLAGRGTDIKITDELEENGGLHVLVTFLPINQRVEEQNYGRAGRKGQKGSHMLVMQYNNEYGHLEKDELTVDCIRRKRDKIELEKIKYLIENDMKFILEKEEIFKKFCYLKNVECQKFNTYQKLNLQEIWAKIIKSEDIEEIKKNFEILQNDKKKNKIKNNLIKLKDIINYADNSEKFFTKIFDLEYEYSWAARLKYSCLLAKEKSGLFNLNYFHNQEKSIEEFEKTKSIIDIFIGNLSSLSSLNKLVFSFLKKNEEQIKDPNFKTEIEKQNEVIKIFLETIKQLIDDNIETIRTYIQENNEKNKIELSKLLSLEDIIKISKLLNLDDKTDIKLFMDEFGFQSFEVLIIKKNKTYIGNIIIISLGVLETCVGAVLLLYSNNPIIFKVARYLIREGIKDIIKGIKATVDGEELNLKSFALEKGVSLVGFALDLALGGTIDIGNSVKDRIFNVVKEECVNLAKTYANKYLANKIVKKLINILENKLKSFLIEPLMDIMASEGENIDKCIQYDIINSNEENKNLILNNCDKIFEEMDNLLDFFGPLIEFVKILSNKNNEEKLPKFLEFLSNFDYKGLINIIDNIRKTIKNSKICNKSKNDLYSLIKNFDSLIDDEKVDDICKELIECGVINKNGELNKKMCQIKGFEQSFILTIDKKYLIYEFNDKKNISNELKEKLNLIFSKMNKVNLNNKKEEIKNDIYNKLENFIQSIIERVLELIEDKASEKIEKLYEKYKNKKKNVNCDLDFENEEKKIKKKENEDEEEQIQLSKKSNSNTINEEEGNVKLMELNNEEIKKAKNKEKKEKSITIVNEKNYKEFFKETSKFCLKFGKQAGINNIFIPKLMEILSDFFKKKLKEKLLPGLFERFDDYFEMFGEHLIILEKKYNFKGYIDTIIKIIRNSFHIITGIQIFIHPIIKNIINKIKKGDDIHKILSDFNQELISKVENEIIIPFKNFINEIFGEKGNVTKYKFFENIIAKGYKKVKEIGIDKFEKIKNIYLEKRKQLCELPNELVKKYEDKKEEIKKKYNEYKEKIINSIDQKIESLDKYNFKIEFKKINKKLKTIINEQLNELKNEAKNKINNITSKIQKFFDIFIEIIDKILNLKFEGITNEDKKINIINHILNFILEVETGKIKLKNKNEKGEEIQENSKDLLFKYLSEKLDIKDINIKEVIEYLFKKGLKPIINKSLNAAINYGQKKYDEIKQYYQPILKMIQSLISMLKEDASKFLEKFREKIDNKIDIIFEYFLKFINYIFKKANVLDLYTLKIEFDYTFKKDLVKNLKKLKEIAVSKIIENLELEIKKLENECDEKIKEISKICSDKINALVDKYENKLFGCINKIIIDENKNSNIKKQIKSDKITEDNKIETKKNEINFNQRNDIIINSKLDKNDNSNELINIKNSEIFGKDLNLNYNIKPDENGNNMFWTKYNSIDDDEDLIELVEKVDKELKEKDIKYNIKRSNENKVNIFTTTYEEDSEEYLNELYDYYVPLEKEKKKDNNDNLNLENSIYNLDNKDYLNKKSDNKDIATKEVNENSINDISDINNGEIKENESINNFQYTFLTESTKEESFILDDNNKTENFKEIGKSKNEKNDSFNINEKKEIMDSNKVNLNSESSNKIENNESNNDISKTNELSQKKLSGQIKGDKFDNIFAKIENFKEKELNFIQSDNVKNTCKKLDKHLIKIANSKNTEIVMNFVDKFDGKKYNGYLDKFKSYSDLLDSKSKEQFRDNAKKLLQDEIFNLYEKYMEPKLKEFAIEFANKIVDKIGEKITKKK